LNGLDLLVRITLICILNNYNARSGMFSSESREELVIGSGEDGNEPSGSIKRVDFLD
jgi:hypothetical protein